MSTRSSLKLSFASGTDGAVAELVKTEFTHPLIELTHRCVRGKSAGACTGAGSFQWTAAVQALTLLFLRQEIGTLTSASETETMLEGDQGTPAASLAFALSKANLWLLDMFGVDPQGRAIARRMIRCSNPEMKRPGPVVLSLNSKFLGELALEVELDGEKVTLLDELERLKLSIETHWRPQRVSNVRALSRHETRPTLTEQSEPNRFLECFRREVRLMLQNTDIFSRERYVKRLSYLQGNSFYNRLSGGAKTSIADFDLSLPAAIRLGEIYDESYFQKALCGSRPVRVWLAASQLPSIVLLHYLKHWRGLNLEVNTRFVHTLEITRALAEREYSAPPDVCVLGYTASAIILNKPDAYGLTPVMLMPRASQRVLAPAAALRSPKKKSACHYRFFSEGPSVSSFYFDRLVSEGAIPKTSCNASHLDPNDISSLDLDDPALRVISWFPYYDFARIQHALTAIDVETDASREPETVLCVGEEIREQESQLRCLIAAIRNAWLVLQHDEALRDEVLQQVLRQPGYLSFLARSGGLPAKSLEDRFRPMFAEAANA